MYLVHAEVNTEVQADTRDCPPKYVGALHGSSSNESPLYTGMASLPCEWHTEGESINPYTKGVVLEPGYKGVVWY